VSTPDTETPETRRLPKEIYVLVAAAFIVALGYGIIAPVLPQFAASFDFGVTAATIVVSSFAFFRFVFSPSSGRLVDAFGERRIYITGLLIVAASTAAVAFAQNYWQLLIFRGLGGIGSTMFSVSAMALIVRLAPIDARAKASSTYATAFLVGNIAGPSSAVRWPDGGCASRSSSTPSVCSSPPSSSASSSPPPPHSAPRRSPGVPAWRRRRTRNSRKSCPSGKPGRIRPTARRSSPPSSKAGRRWASAWPSTRSSPSRHSRADTAVAGLALTMFAIGNASAVTVVGRFADTVGRKPFIQWGLFVLGVTTAALAFIDSIWLFFAFSVIAGVGSGLANPAQQATVADVIGRERKGGRVLARYQMALDGGAILGPIIAGAVVDHFDYSWAFLLTGVLGVIAAGLWFFGRETRPRQPASTQ
jgi:DHA1 family multidrug resistance protein-like MFS transporter